MLFSHKSIAASLILTVSMDQNQSISYIYYSGEHTSARTGHWKWFFVALY